LTVKTDDVTKGRKDVDLHGRFRGEWVNDQCSLMTCCVNTLSHLLLWIVTSWHHQIFTKVLTNHSVLTIFKIFPLHPSLLGKCDMTASILEIGKRVQNVNVLKHILKKIDHSIDEVFFSSLQAYLARVKFFLPWYLAHDTLIWF